MNDIIIALLGEIQIADEPEIPFPQANDFEKVIDICEWLHSRVLLEKMVVAGNYEFHERQENYYTDAARYLGLVEINKLRGKKIYRLSDEGFRIIELDGKERDIELFKCIIRHEVFQKALKKLLADGKMSSTEEIVDMMKKCNLYKVESDSTYARRATTVQSWLKWITKTFNLL